MIAIPCVVILFLLIFLTIFFSPKKKTTPLPEKKCPVNINVPYMVNNKKVKFPDLEGKPLPGFQQKIDKCHYVSVLRDPGLSFDQKQDIIEKHVLVDSEAKVCDQDCNDYFIQQLYESYLIKSCLENFSFNSQIMIVYHKVFDAMKRKLGSDKYNKIAKEWVANVEHNYFPVSQQNRPWKNYTNPYVLFNLGGVDIDPTSLLLAGNFMKTLSTVLPADYKALRDYSFNSILKRIRGYRTNQRNRMIKKDYKKESQVGIVNFDFPELDIKLPYFKNQPWKHPGRSQCDVGYLQGTYQHEAYNRSIPLECGVSGSTNFWLWTIVWTEIDLTLTESALLVFSAFLILGADGGHSLNEVLTTATLDAIFWKDYLQYSKDKTFAKIFDSSFAQHLYTITKSINPVGHGEFIPIDYSEIAHKIFNFNKDCIDPKYLSDKKKCHYYLFDDKSILPSDEIDRRKELEAFFAYNRCDLSFGDYQQLYQFLTIPEFNSIRNGVIKKVEQYVKTYC